MKQLASLFVLAAACAAPVAHAQQQEAVRDVVTSRKLVSSDYKHAQPGAPSGYFVK